MTFTKCPICGHAVEPNKECAQKLIARTEFEHPGFQSQVAWKDAAAVFKHRNRLNWNRSIR